MRRQKIVLSRNIRRILIFVDDLKGLGVPGKITTVAELEANLKEMDMSNNNRQHKAIPGGASHGLGVTPGVAPASMTSGQAVSIPHL